jgi:hypothetical protein
MGEENFPLHGGKDREKGGGDPETGNGKWRWLPCFPFPAHCSRCRLSSTPALFADAAQELAPELLLCSGKQG